jgi:predicted aminopeptidase
MDQDANVQEGAAFDPAVGMVVTDAGKQRWKRVLEERAANRDVAALRTTREQLRLGPTATA